MFRVEAERRSVPIFAETAALRCLARRFRTPRDFASYSGAEHALLIAAGISAPTARRMRESQKQQAIDRLVRNCLQPAGANFVEELVFRFLLTRGDTLGGSMRNVGGFMAQCKLTRSLIAHLNLSGAKYRWLSCASKAWADKPEEDTDIELNLRGLAWGQGTQARTLVYNLTVPLFGNNVDFCLFHCASDAMCRDIHANASAYVALGELKGGIDPAGADEHWKTARTALVRIREAFRKHKLTPHTFFVGAAIETKMANEIWTMLERGELENAANLTADEQIASLTRWLCSL